MDREQIKNIAIKMVHENGLINLSRRELCTRAGIADGSFAYIMGCSFSTFIDELRNTPGCDVSFPVSKARANPTLRKEQILNVALELAKDCGYQNITREAIAEKAGVSVGLVSRCYGTMNLLKKAVMRAAVNREIDSIVAQGLVMKDTQALKAPAELKHRALSNIANS